MNGVIIVTLPQAVSVEDARRGLNMFRELKIPVMGVVENMSYLELPDGQKMEVFGSGGGEALAKEAGVHFMGSIPMDPAVREGGDGGKPIVIAKPDSPAANAICRIAYDAALKASVAAVKEKSRTIPIQMVN